MFYYTTTLLILPSALIFYTQTVSMGTDMKVAIRNDSDVDYVCYCLARHTFVGLIKPFDEHKAYLVKNAQNRPLQNSGTIS